MAEGFTDDVVQKVADRMCEREAYDRINALFAKHDDGGNCAYCRLLGDQTGMLELQIECPAKGFVHRADQFQIHVYPYLVLVNGYWKDEGKPSAPLDSLEQAVERSVIKVMERWPQHEKLQVVWRHHPKVGIVGPAPPSRQLYMRLVATPVV